MASPPIHLSMDMSPSPHIVSPTTSNGGSPRTGSPRRQFAYGDQTFDITGNSSMVNLTGVVGGGGGIISPRRGQDACQQRRASLPELKHDADKFETNRARFRAPARYDQGAGLTSADVRARDERTVKKQPDTEKQPTSMMGPQPTQIAFGLGFGVGTGAIKLSRKPVAVPSSGGQEEAPRPSKRSFASGGGINSCGGSSFLTHDPEGNRGVKDDGTDRPIRKHIPPPVIKQQNFAPVDPQYRPEAPWSTGN